MAKAKANVKLKAKTLKEMGMEDFDASATTGMLGKAIQSAGKVKTSEELSNAISSMDKSSLLSANKVPMTDFPTVDKVPLEKLPTIDKTVSDAIQEKEILIEKQDPDRKLQKRVAPVKKTKATSKKKSVTVKRKSPPGTFKNVDGQDVIGDMKKYRSGY